MKTPDAKRGVGVGPMTSEEDTSSPPHSTTGRTPVPLADLLAGLEGAMTEQLDLTRTDRIAAACDLTPLIDALLDAVGAHGPDALTSHAEAITRIRTLRQTLDLTLAQRKDEYTRRRTEMQQGKKLLRAYAQSAPPAIRGSM